MAGIGQRVSSDVPVVTAPSAIRSIPDDATLLVSGFGSVGYPKAVPRALAASDRDLSLTIVSGGSVGEEIDTGLVERDAISRRIPFVATDPAREAVNDGRIAFTDRHIAGLGDEVRYGNLADPDVAVIEAIAIGDDWLIPSTSIGHTPSFVAAADRAIVEVNESQPLELARFHDVYRPGPPPDRSWIPLDHAGDRIGDPRIDLDDTSVEAVVRTDRPDDAYAFREPTETDEAIASNVVGVVEREIGRTGVFADRVHLQIGVGSIGNAIMAGLTRADVGRRDLVYFGEVVQDGLLDAIDGGAIGTASATSLALSRAGQRRLLDDPERYAESIVLRPADVSNAPQLIDRFGVIGINSALEVDLYGHANSTHLGGTRLVSGIGGSGDFARNALVSIVALPARTAVGGIPRVVPKVPHVDHTEHDIDVVVTDRGIADLRGRSPRERAELILQRCAHPGDRESLTAYLDRAGSRGNEPHDLESAYDRYRR